MNTAGLNLLIPDKPDVERDALAGSFAQGGGDVHRIGRFWEPPTFDPATVRVYGPDAFCLVLQQKIGFRLLSPDDDFLLRLPPELLGRELHLRRLASGPHLTYPAFVKPVVPKQFRGAVYMSSRELEAECKGLPGDTPVIVSGVVTFDAEVRCFVLDGKVLDAAAYEGHGAIAEAIAFAGEVIKRLRLPRALVIDVGHLDGRGWAVVEFNAAWGAGLNGCEPSRVLPAILAASAPG
ncbi:MAG TPA: ATP-grasp domain-containing protein [Lacunisphaera sp.]|nr:ATP-grasp domain-containing protein [Lacunisphaera sp.]